MGESDGRISINIL